MPRQQGSNRLDRRHLVAAAACVLTALATPVAAQQGPERASAEAGLRSLSWPGKPSSHAGLRAAATVAADAPAPSAEPDVDPARARPSVMPTYVAAEPAFPTSLTPATAFGVPATPAAGAPRQIATAAAPTTPVAQTPVPQTPVRSPRTRAAVADDPMAPRADAPIHRLAAADDAAAPAASPRAATPGRDGARYYSVHREAGRDPDPTVLPAPFFLDSAPVDLAEPPPPPTLMRDQRGLAASVADTGL